jgi:hypothetical protein
VVTVAATTVTTVNQMRKAIRYLDICGSPGPVTVSHPIGGDDPG